MKRLDDLVQGIAAVIADVRDGALPLDVGPFALASRRFICELIARLEDGRFHDPGFVRTLAIDSDVRYLNAIRDPAKRPGPWKVAMAVAARDRHKVLRNLLLGINAHVSYDLVVTLSKFLAKPVRAEQREDFMCLNDLIRSAIDGVQDDLERDADQWMLGADYGVGRVDEWLTSLTFVVTRGRAFDDALRSISA